MLEETWLRFLDNVTSRVRSACSQSTLTVVASCEPVGGAQSAYFLYLVVRLGTSI